MLATKILLWFALLWAVMASPLLEAQQHPVPEGITYANYIFNALHNSMKQFGSVLQHNGMSFFIATIPEGTEFYHGTSTPQRINATEWLAFEPEHALAFAHPRRTHHSGTEKDTRPVHYEEYVRGQHSDHAKHWEHEDVQHTESQGHIHRENKDSWKPDHARHWEHENILHAESWRHTNGHESASGHSHKKSRPASGPGFLMRQWTKGVFLLKSTLPFKGQKPHSSGEVPAHNVPRSHRSSRTDRKTESHPQGTINNHNSFCPQESSTTNEEFGYLHTYRTKHDLRLVYFDGQSAAKSIKGTLDTQDIVLRNASHFDGSPMEGDNVRADELCAMARDEWDNRVDGFLRMVGGFEIILCSFAHHLDVVNIVATYPEHGRDSSTSLSYAMALATRSNGIGGDRVSVNYENFLTIFSFPDAMYFDDNGLPRVVNDSTKLQDVRARIKTLVTQPESPMDLINWQAVVDMIITRYAYRINMMLSSAVPNHHELRRQLHLALEPFIDARARNSTLEIERCSTQFWPSNANLDTIPAQAVNEVSRHLCSSLVTAAKSVTYEEGITIIHNLKRYLDWTVFRKCASCRVDEVCQLPIWPSGSKEDFIQPQCGDGLLHGTGGYWDMMGKFREHRD